MTYEIGQQVETPLGVVGKIVQSNDEMSKVSIKSVDGVYTYFYKFMTKKLKPYKTAHEKLIENDFNYEYNECNDELSDKVHTYYNPKRYIKIEVTVTPNGVGWHTHFYDPYNYIANLELLEIIKQLVEEMAEWSTT